MSELVLTTRQQERHNKLKQTLSYRIYKPLAPHTNEIRLMHIVNQSERSVNWAVDDELNIMEYKKFQMLEGEGIRSSLYVSHCKFACVECYNPISQIKGQGTPYTQELEQEILTDMQNPNISGITLVGGEPFLNAKQLLPLVTRIKVETNKTIWSYTGYLFEVLLTVTDERRELLSHIDVLIDGQFIQEERDESNLLPFRGSNNQRLIDVQESLKQNKTVLYSLTQ